MASSIYIVFSQARYAYSYSEHMIHCVTLHEEEANRHYDLVDRSDCAGVTLLEVDGSVSWTTPYELFNFDSHPQVRVVREWFSV
jgi:hypothetical protein